MDIEYCFYVYCSCNKFLYRGRLMMAKKISSKFVAGLALTGLFATTALTVTKAHDLFGSTSVSPVVNQVNTSNNADYTTGGPIDATLADEQGIVEMLKKEGKIPQDATARETHEAYEAYIQEISKQNNVKLSKEERDLQAKKIKLVQLLLIHEVQMK